MSRNVTPRSTYDNSKGLPLCLKSGAIPTGIYKVTAFKQNGGRHVSLIGRHLESVGRTEPVFELNLAPSEKKADLRISVRFATFVEALCQGKGQRSHRAKN